MDYVEINITSADQFRGQFQEPSKISLPALSLKGKSVLDIGCGTGKDLTHEAFTNARRFGIDIDPELIAYGQSRYPDLELINAEAERLPFPNLSFDFVCSRVALPYTDIPVALREIARVMRPGGEVLLTLHDWRMEMHWIIETARAKAWRNILKHAYVVVASVVYALTGRVIRCPWNRTRETFQTRFLVRRQLKHLGFTNIRFERTNRHFIAHAKLQPI